MPPLSQLRLQLRLPATVLFLLLLLLLPPAALVPASAADGKESLDPLLVAQPHDTKRVPDLKLDFGSSAPPQPPEPPAPSRTVEAAAAAAAATERPPAFWDLISPVAEKAFFEEFWTRRPLHIVRGRAAAIEQQRGQTTKKRVVANEPPPQPYSDLVASCAIDQLLRGSPTLQVRRAPAASCRTRALPPRFFGSSSCWRLNGAPCVFSSTAPADVHARAGHGGRTPRRSTDPYGARRRSPPSSWPRAGPICERVRGVPRWLQRLDRDGRDVVR
jgi:hypothetical protein